MLVNYIMRTYDPVWFTIKRYPFSGKLGKQLTNCEKLPIINFEALELDEININKTDLIEDQMYLLDIVRASLTGHCTSDLAIRDPGPLSHSRWLTCAKACLTLVHFPNKLYKQTQNATS
ncbi:hypothetical protein AVEN_160065-1 [Araneus ventricosus]|uniref:Uncharacterized protein n=1 Tax=Araneus ventricosus TaxID=182803 RepID=A0A4Y2L295_ARAVE|nr:hypothetical protein AVEN_17379-1 [Araneus ventricosus]GBN08714.1 hypothetical protein AVEN_160065-1 [Araneus ventricosus]